MMRKAVLFLSTLALFNISCADSEESADKDAGPEAAPEPEKNKPDTQELARKLPAYPTDEDFRRWRQREPDPMPAACAEPPNLLLDGSFDVRPFFDCRWVSYDIEDWGTTAVQTCWDESRKGCVAFLETDVWGHSWAAQFYQSLLLEPGRYKLSFWARAEERPRPLTVRIIGTGNLEPIGTGIEIELTKKWRQWEFEFEVTDLEEGQVVNFDFGAASRGLYLDDVMLLPSPTAPAPDAGIPDSAYPSS